MRDARILLESSRKKRRRALEILRETKLMEAWGRFGRPVLVGAVAYDLVYEPDIDMEIYCGRITIEDGFRMLSECCAEERRFVCARFENHLADPDQALYWQLRYREDDGTEWKFDMWSAPESYALPRSEYVVGPMLQALDDETRGTILALKEYRAENPLVRCPSIDIYRAVLDDGVRSAEDFREWLSTHEVGALTGWVPAVGRR